MCAAQAAVYAGSFDPVTNGHLDIIRRASRLFSPLTVLVMDNGAKKPLFAKEERVKLLQEVLADLPQVRVDCAEGLLVDYLKKTGTHLLVRGVRTGADLDPELANAHHNHLLFNDVETVFLPARASERFTSSSVVREIASLGGDVSALVPERVAQALRKKF